MSFHIENEETCRLAGELAGLTGETMAGAVTTALHERLERERRRCGADTLARELHAPSDSAAPVSWGRGRRPLSMAICFTMSWACPSDSPLTIRSLACRIASIGGVAWTGWGEEAEG